MCIVCVGAEPAERHASRGNEREREDVIALQEDRVVCGEGVRRERGVDVDSYRVRMCEREMSERVGSFGPTRG